MIRSRTQGVKADRASQQELPSEVLHGFRAFLQEMAEGFRPSRIKKNKSRPPESQKALRYVDTLLDR